MNKPDTAIWANAPTSEQLVTDRLRSHILEGDLPVGEFLSQRKLADLAESSVISVRGALRQLENEGLIENVPHQGVRIPKETGATLRDRYFMRSILETAAVEKICGQIPPQTAGKLMDMAKELDRLAGEHTETNALSFAKLHHEFHLLIAESAGNPLLVQLLCRVINASQMLLNAKRSWKAPSERTQNHAVLAQALISGPMDTAVRSIREHIQTGLESELAVL